MTDKRYRECMTEIVAVLKKYDMAGAVTVVSTERAMFKYHFPTWSCITFEGEGLRFRAKRADYPSAEAQREAVELSAHIIMQMRDIAAQTFTMCQSVGKALEEKVGLEHKPFQDFDPEHDH
jgi:hypothetical protein